MFQLCQSCLKVQRVGRVTVQLRKCSENFTAHGCLAKQGTSFHTASIQDARGGPVDYSPVVQKKRNVKHFYSQHVLPWTTQDQLAQELLGNILYEDDFIVAINKPSMLPMHALKYSEIIPMDVPPPESAELSVMSSLPALQKKIGASDELRPVYSQNRLHSGVVIFSKTPKVHKKLETYFKHIRTQKVLALKYWAITAGCPSPAADQVSFPLEKIQQGDRIISVKATDVSTRRRKGGKIIVPEINYRVLDYNPGWNVSLVQIQPTASQWDSMQVFLMTKLSPILGDYIYSSRVQYVSGQPVLMDPAFTKHKHMKLSPELQRALKTTSGDETYIPLHLHCAEVELPNLAQKKSSVTIRAPPPETFAWTLHALHLRAPSAHAQESHDEQGNTSISSNNLSEEEQLVFDR